MNLAEPGELKAFLAKHGLNAFKRLGQHFLCSSAAVEKIVAACEGCKGLLEIGPGPGVLTAALSERCEKMIALEVDLGMIAALKESAPKAQVLKQDALKADLSALLGGLPEPRGIVSNMPYYISGPLLQIVAARHADLDRAVLMMQKEVAMRVIAKPRESERGSLSVFLQSIFNISIVVQVPAGAFLPPPKVNSTVLLFKPRESAKALGNLYFRTIRLGFAQPRKTLTNNLMAGFHIPRETALAALESAGLGERSRSQELTEAEWMRLGSAMEGITGTTA